MKYMDFKKYVFEGKLLRMDFNNRGTWFIKLKPNHEYIWFELYDGKVSIMIKHQDFLNFIILSDYTSVRVANLMDYRYWSDMFNGGNVHSDWNGFQEVGISVAG